MCHVDLGTSKFEQNRPKHIIGWISSLSIPCYYNYSKSMYPVQGSLVIDGGVIVIVQALISQVSLIP